MKKIFSFMMVAALAILLGGCQKYDDSELRNEIEGLKARLAAVESLNSYKDLLAKLDNGKTVTGVSENNGVYTLTFDDNTSITFNQKGEPGAPGESITGPEGQPGVTPKFRINEETTTWEVSYDGETWTEVGSAMDHSLIAGVVVGEDGDSITISLADGTAIIVPCLDPNVVDMGVSVLWAKCNLGASAPEERGSYYAWGDTKLLPNSEDYSYKWGDVKNKQLTKYVISSDYGEVDGKTSLDREDDIAFLTLGGKYRMPSEAECEELINNCTIADATLNDMRGILFTSKINGNTLFFPLSGYALNRWYNENYTRGYYWTSDLHATDSGTAYSFWIYSKDGSIATRIVQDSVCRRYIGQSIRPVKTK